VQRRLTSERARPALQRLRARSGEPDAFYVDLLALLERQGLSFVGACWHLTDPITGLFTWTGYQGELPGDFVSALVNEFAEEDVAKYSELARRPRKVASLVHETAGSPHRSPRYRGFLEEGFADELRLAFVDAFGRWGSLGLFSDRAFAPSDVIALGELVPAVTRTLRAGIALGSAPPADERAGVLVLDRDDRVRSRDARAATLLAGAAATGALPGAVYVLAARARREADTVQGRMLVAGGVWVAIEATPLLGDEHEVVVVLRPASAPSVLEVRLRAAGLTEREREVALGVLRGDDTRELASALHLSPWTVQDHLKAIFAKTGVRSRRAFVAAFALPAAGVA
jgi:DNA-binding CsgD family transcriptional regulator